MTEQIDWRKNITTISGLHLGRCEVLRNLRQYLRAQIQGHHAIDRLEERGVERGINHSTIFLERTREGHPVGQTNIGTVSGAKLGKRLRD